MDDTFVAFKPSNIDAPEVLRKEVVKGTGIQNYPYPNAINHQVLEQIY